MPNLSVIIPTHRRAAILRECLRRLEAQTIKDRIEVIVVSDGHDDETAKLFLDHTQYAIPHTQFFEIPKSQQGVARNRGVERAAGDIILFAQDDIFLEPEACEVHLRTHQRMYNVQCTMKNDGNNSGTESAPNIVHFPFSILHSNPAVLGYTRWDPTLERTTAMDWLDWSGWQFGYRFLKPFEHSYIPKEMQHRFSYTSHISLPRDIALKFPFREDVTLYGWEDIEWGWRLWEAGIPLFYEPDARALHHHRMTLEDSLKRMETLGRSARVIEQINPRLSVVPKGLKLFAYQLASLLPTMGGRHRASFLHGLSGA